MIKVLNKQTILLTLLILFSSLQFFLLIRHKDPFISDSYFYEHVYYTYQGMNFDQAYQKVKSEIDYSKSDDITNQLFNREDRYKNALSFFDKRPFYPFLAYLLSFTYKNNYINMLIPVFVGYIGTIITAFFLIKEIKGKFFAAFVVSLLVAFYPFLDWSTYFLTDTLGSFFWLVQLLFIYRFIKEGNKNYLIGFLTIYVIGFFNREQNILMLPLVILLGILLRVYQKDLYKKRKKEIFSITILTGVISVIYILTTILTKQKSVFDTLIYNQSNYGLIEKDFTLQETFDFWISYIILFFQKLVRDIYPRHWTVVFLTFSIIVIIYTFIFKRKPSFLDILIICSTFVSAIFVFFCPIFSYRYFYPAIIGIIYFTVVFIWDFFNVRD